MTNTGLLAISELLDIKLAPIQETQTAMHGELTELRGEIGGVKAELKDDINALRVSQTRKELLLENDVLPRLQNIEACYTDAYDKYSGGIAEIIVLKTDMSIMKNVLKEHTEKLRTL